jgi:hypothetical protein
MSTFTSHQLALVVGRPVPLSWRHTRFYQSIAAGGYCLHGFPVAELAYVQARFTHLGCTIQGWGACSQAPTLGWVHFTGPQSVAAALSLQFPAPSGATPLLVTGKGALGKRRGARVLVQAQV